MVFMVSIIVILVGALVALTILTKKQNEPSEKFFAYQATDYTNKLNDFSIEKQPMIGEEDAPVEMILFYDYNCIHCLEFETTVFPSIEKELINTGKAKLYFVNYPFMNDSSFKAAVAAESVFKQNPDEFLRYFKGIYSMQNNAINNWANAKTLVDKAKELNIQVDYVKLENDIKNYKDLDSVYLDRAFAEAKGIQGTPNLIINGTAVDTRNYESIKKVVDVLVSAEEKKEETTKKENEEATEEKANENE